MPRRRLLAATLLAALLGAVISCGAGQDLTAPTLSDITLSPRTWSLAPGATFHFTPEFHGGDQLLAPRPVVWSSSDPSKVSVSAAGVVRGIAPGTAFITATAEGLSGRAIVVVQDSGVVSLSGTTIPVRPPASP